MQHLEAIILAGGEGSRVGGGKLTAPYRGGRLIDGALRAALAAPVERIVLVTGYDAQAVGDAAMSLASREHPDQDLRVVHAESFRKGMAETLKVGVAALSAGVEAAFVFLGDMPHIPLSLPIRLANGLGDRRAAAPVFQGQRGHPVLFAASLFPQLLQLSGDRGAGRLLDELKGGLVLIAVEDAGVIFDVDRPSDLTHEFG